MKKILDFVEENTFSIFLIIGLGALFAGIIIFEIKLSYADLFNLEEKCFNFYKENNYIL